VYFSLTQSEFTNLSLLCLLIGTDAFGAGPIALDLKSVASRAERYKPDSHLADVLGHDLSKVLSMELGNGEFIFAGLTCCGIVSTGTLAAIWFH
jgi:hypothetical protein